MSEIINESVDLEEVIELPDLKEGDEGYDKVDWKDLAAKNHGIAKRNATKLAKLKANQKPADDKPENKAGKEEKKEGLDRVDRAVLRAEKITDPKEVELVESIMKETGKDLEAVLSSRYFQGEIKALREEMAADAAAPSGNKRANAASADTVEYWVAKGELPPKEQVELRRKVVNARMQAERTKNQFSDNPIS